MKPDVVVDVGNSRIKWGLCDADGSAAMASLPPNDPPAWQKQAENWQLSSGMVWAVAGVQPQCRDALIEWLQRNGARVLVLDSYKLLPIQVKLPNPEQVGLDRLLNAVAANHLRNPKNPAIIVDAGSAVTVDLVDVKGNFRGGAIFPGIRLMARALHDYTALLPLVEIGWPAPAVGADTEQAIQAGIFWGVLGGISMLVERQHDLSDATPDIFGTGGDGPRLVPALRELDWPVKLRPGLTLDGIFLAAQEHSFAEKTS